MTMKMAVLPALIAGLALVPGGGAGTNGSPCAAAQLRGTVGGSQGAAGTIALSVILRNVSRVGCTLAGYPALRMTSASGRVRTRVRHGGLAFLAKPARRFVVDPGGHSTLLLAYSDVPHGTEKTCPMASALLIRPTGAAGDVRVRVRLAPCNRGLVYESPLLPGAVPVP